MVLTLLPALSSVASAAGATSYLDVSGNAAVSPSTTLDYTGQTALGAAGTPTWYSVAGNQVSTSRIVISGDVRIILEDYCHLDASSGGIQVQGTDSLTIYAQSKGGSMGSLTATGSSGGAGIGSGGYNAGGNITITGGGITATGGNYGAGIGGGDRRNGGNITISGGNITATSRNFGAGIGVGYDSGGGGNITITGGKITAHYTFCG